jgi:hypothetical protein
MRDGRGVAGAAAAIVAVVLTGVAGCANDDVPAAAPASASASPVPLPGSASPVPLPASASAGPASSPSGPAAAVPASIPASAFLQAADAEKGEAPQPVDPPVGPPSFCGATFASYRDIGIRRSSTMLWRHRSSPEGSVPSGTVTDTVTVYRGGGATQFMTDLRKAVAGCPAQKVGGTTHSYRSLGSVSAGDDSVLVEDATPAYAEDGSPLSGKHYRYWAAVRAGDSVTLVKNEGWEGASADRGESSAFARKAAKRLADWRG